MAKLRGQVVFERPDAYSIVVDLWPFFRVEPVQSGMFHRSEEVDVARITGRKAPE